MLFTLKAWSHSSGAPVPTKQTLERKKEEEAAMAERSTPSNSAAMRPSRYHRSDNTFYIGLPAQSRLDRSVQTQIQMDPWLLRANTVRLQSPTEPTTGGMFSTKQPVKRERETEKKRGRWGVPKIMRRHLSRHKLLIRKTARPN